MTAERDYWKECISIAAEECGLEITTEQIDYIASSVEAGHDNYGMAFYSPPSTDMYYHMEREWKEKFESLQKEHQRYVGKAEKAIKQALNVHPDEHVSIGEYGEVFKYNGRSVQIQ